MGKQEILIGSLCLLLISAIYLLIVEIKFAVEVKRLDTIIELKYKRTIVKVILASSFVGIALGILMANADPSPYANLWFWICTPSVPIFSTGFFIFVILIIRRLVLKR